MLSERLCACVRDTLDYDIRVDDGLLLLQQCEGMAKKRRKLFVVFIYNQQLTASLAASAAFALE